MKLCSCGYGRLTSFAIHSAINNSTSFTMPEDYTEYALRLRDDFLDGRVDIHAPKHLSIGGCHRPKKYYLNGFIGSDTAERVLELIASSEIRLYEIDIDMTLKSLRMSLDYNVTVYDAAYLVLASRLSATLYTAYDRLLSNQKMLARNSEAYKGVP